MIVCITFVTVTITHVRELPAEARLTAVGVNYYYY